MVEYLDLIRKIVWSYIKTNPDVLGLEFEDLFSEACIACLQAMPEYDPNKGGKSTFIWRVTHNHMRTFIGNERCRKEKEYVSDFTDGEAEVYLYRNSSPSPEQLYIIKEAWEEMASGFSEEAQVLCDVVMNEKEVYLPMDKPKFCRGILMRVLRKMGWSWRVIWNSFREIKQALQQQMAV